MSSKFYIYYLSIPFICLFLTLIYFNSFFTALLSLILALYFCKNSVGCSQTESTLNISIKVPKRGIAHVHNFAKLTPNNFTDSNQADFENQTIHRRATFTQNYDSDIYLNSTSPANFFDTPKIMWANRSFSNKPQSAANKKRNGLNTTLPARPTPLGMATRLRRSDATNSLSPLAAAGPLLSSPFMPQIKRALGLEPDQQRNYSASRRHTMGLGVRMPSSPLSPGVVPHVRLDKPRRLSLSERNTSMLNRSTVKIAPPISGLVGSPSFYQARAESSMMEDSSTADTYAVISALKERRKRSINLSDETPELPTQQFKRRRQESQQSTSSNSSLPGPPMPDNLPDLSAVSFTPRLETPGVKRPSRPSQSDPLDWELGGAKRPRSESRNNSILSSLSSSKRYMENQNSKRKADSSFSEKENGMDDRLRKQRRDTVIFPSDHSIYQPPVRLPDVEKGATPSNVVNGQTNKHAPDDKNQQVATKGEVTKPPLLKNATSMKKSSSIYSGLSKAASVKKPQYANVVATADDYDADRETEQKRVKQILQDLDQSFTVTAGKVKNSAQEAPTAGLTTTDGATPGLPAVSTVPSLTVPLATATAATTTATASVTTATVTQPVTTATVTTSISGVKETVAQQESGGVATEPGTSAGISAFKPLFDGAVTTSATTSSLPGGFSFGAATTATTTTAAETKPGGFSFGLSSSGPTTPPNSAPSAVIGGQTSLGAPPPYSFAPSQTSTPAAPGFNFGTGSVSSAPSPATASLNFGTSLASVAGNQLSTNTPAVSQPATTQAQPAGGFNFGAIPASQSTTSAGGFSLNPQTTIQSASVLPGGNTTATNAGGFQFGRDSLTTTTVSSLTPTFGLPASTAITTAAGLSFGQNAPAPSSVGGFSFTPTPATTLAAAGLGFGAGSTSVAGGFSYNASGAPAAGLFSGSTPSTNSSTPVFGAPASSVAPAFGMPLAVSTSVGPVFGNTPATQTVQFGANTTTTASTGLSFGSGIANPSHAFDAVATTSVNPAFGATPSTTAAPAFAFGGAATTTAATATPFQAGNQPAFATGLSFGQTPGISTAAASPFQFGAAPTTNTAPVFGNTAVTQSAPAFGNTPVTQSAPAFGNTPVTQSAPAFGNTPVTQSAPSFGAINPTPTFGASTSAFGVSTTQSGSVFGAVPKSNTPVFGATANPPAFGTATTSTPGFGKSHSMPVFSANMFGAGNTGPAPNVNPFGAQQTTPVKQTGSVFGQTANTTPTQQPSGVVQFGQGNIAATDTASRGFDFSSSTAGAGGGGFNFSANTSAFGTPGGTPGGFGASAPGAFNVGAASSTPRPPRANIKARRRTAKRQ